MRTATAPAQTTWITWSTETSRWTWNSIAGGQLLILLNERWKMISIASCCVCKSIVQESGNSLMECNTCQNLYHQVSLTRNMLPSLAFPNSALRCATILQSAMKKPKTPGWSGTVWNAQSEYWKRTTHNLIITHGLVSGARKLKELRNWNSLKRKSLERVPPLQCWPAAVPAWSSPAPRLGSQR